MKFIELLVVTLIGCLAVTVGWMWLINLVGA